MDRAGEITLLIGGLEQKTMEEICLVDDADARHMYHGFVTNSINSG